jgi:hypothetical protein
MPVGIARIPRSPDLCRSRSPIPSCRRLRSDTKICVTRVQEADVAVTRVPEPDVADARIEIDADLTVAATPDADVPVPVFPQYYCCRCSRTQRLPEFPKPKLKTPLFPSPMLPLPMLSPPMFPRPKLILGGAAAQTCAAAVHPPCRPGTHQQTSCPPIHGRPPAQRHGLAVPRKHRPDFGGRGPSCP